MTAAHRLNARALAIAHDTIRKPTAGIPESRRRLPLGQQLPHDLLTKHHLRPVQNALPRRRVAHDQEGALPDFSQISGASIW